MTAGRGVVASGMAENRETLPDPKPVETPTGWLDPRHRPRLQDQGRIPADQVKDPWERLRGENPTLAARHCAIRGNVPQPVAQDCADSLPRYAGSRMNDDWKSEFQNVWKRAIAAWKAGRKSAKAMFEPKDAAFLATIGCTTQELFDFVDDFLGYDDFDFETVLGVTAVRRGYFLDVMLGKSTGHVVPMGELPAKAATVDGIAWLPRLIAKARIKLRGEMNPDLMYGCAGDRPFLREHGMTLPQFLQLVRDKGDDDRAIVEAVKKSAARN